MERAHPGSAEQRLRLELTDEEDLQEPILIRVAFREDTELLEQSRWLPEA